jgi:hypothetical protein
MNKMTKPGASGRRQPGRQQKYGTPVADRDGTTQASDAAHTIPAAVCGTTSSWMAGDVPTKADHYFVGDTCADQRTRLLGALKHGPVGAIEARKRLDVLDPQERIRDLRLLGHNIQTILVWVESGDGAERKCVPKYQLVQSPSQPTHRTSRSRS